MSCHSFQSSLSGPNTHICTPSRPSSSLRPSYLWQPYSYSQRTIRFWTIARSNGLSQVPTSRTWQTVEIRADRQADSPLGGDLDICSGTVLDRFVTIYKPPSIRVSDKSTSVACLMVAFVLPAEIPIDRPFVTMKVVYFLNAALRKLWSTYT